MKRIYEVKKEQVDETEFDKNNAILIAEDHYWNKYERSYRVDDIYAKIDERKNVIFYRYTKIDHITDIKQYTVEKSEIQVEILDEAEVAGYLKWNYIPDQIFGYGIRKIKDTLIKSIADRLDEHLELVCEKECGVLKALGRENAQSYIKYVLNRYLDIVYVNGCLLSKDGFKILIDSIVDSCVELDCLW